MEQVSGVMPSSLPSIPVSHSLNIDHSSQGVSGSRLDRGLGDGLNLGASGSGLGRRVDPGPSDETGHGGIDGVGAGDNDDDEEDMGSVVQLGPRADQGEPLELAGLDLD